VKTGDVIGLAGGDGELMSNRGGGDERVVHPSPTLASGSPNLSGDSAEDPSSVCIEVKRGVSLPW